MALQLLAATLGVVAALVLVAMVVRPREIPLASLRLRYGAPTSKFLTLQDGAVIHVRDEGVRSAPVILMVPGLHSSLHIWDGWTSRLRDEFRVISVDLPGQGLSDSWPRDDYSIPALDGFITEITKTLGVSRFTFAGHSMSGAMAWRYAVTHPERVSALILVAAGGFVTRGAGPILPFRVLAAPIIGPVARRLITRPMVRMILRKSYGNPDQVTSELVERNYELINGEGHPASLGKRLRYLLSYEPVNRIDGIRVPTLLVWGEADRLRPMVYAAMFHEHIKGSILRVHPGIGHFPMEEAPEATAAQVKAFMGGM
jgi:pimeloyl-ACP methyl ester carboxylesterase